ncbi:MAG: 50S ribosomal protein L11 methyltransferase [Methyloceanibacter sp.]|uniref:50S ribosomal protein L11 methyltransferase n=1 Tax=Methyloceanibacter sp. TaxID=1965321 RepID=UPI003D9AE1F3
MSDTASPSLYEARLATDAGTAERIVAALEEADAPPVVVGQFEIAPGQAEVFAHFPAAPDQEALQALIAGAANGSIVGALCIEPIADADWVTLSQGMRRPVRAGRFLIHGSYDRAHGLNRFAIEIDAGRAFGTAHHASTRGCLIAFDQILKSRHPKMVLDIGTGSGVLAIAAAKTLGAKIAASDNDPVAVATAAANARQNGVGPQLSCLTAEGLAHPILRRLRADLIFANILARPLLRLAPTLLRHTANDGFLVLSGITQDQAPEVEARYRSFGFVLKRRILLEGWATLVLQRRSLRKARVRD